MYLCDANTIQTINIMKKFLSFAAFALLMTATCFSFVACGDDDDDNGGKSDNSFKKVLVGRWMLRLTCSPGSSTWNTYPVTDNPTTMQFYKNGTYEFSSAGIKSSATYKLNGNKVTITDKKGTKQVFEISKTSEDNNRIQVDIYDADGKTVTDIYEYHRCPANEAEAKEMLVGQWIPDMDFSTLAGSFDMILTNFEKDGRMMYIYHVKNDVKESSSLYNYRGKYIYFPEEVHSYVVLPKDDNPSSGNIRHWSDTDPDQFIPYAALTPYSVSLNATKTRYTRIPSEAQVPFEECKK